jgi:single-strand DNA-binding protein
MNVNNVVLAGHLTRDPELKTFENGSVCNFTVAVNNKYKSRTGELKEDVAFIACVCWGALAEVVNKNLSKGSPIFVEGKIKTESWEDSTGKKQHKTRVSVANVQFLNNKSSGE